MKLTTAVKIVTNNRSPKNGENMKALILGVDIIIGSLHRMICHSPEYNNRRIFLPQCAKIAPGLGG